MRFTSENSQVYRKCRKCGRRSDVSLCNIQADIDRENDSDPIDIQIQISDDVTNETGIVIIGSSEFSRIIEWMDGDGLQHIESGELTFSVTSGWGVFSTTVAAPHTAYAEINISLPYISIDDIDMEKDISNVNESVGFMLTVSNKGTAEATANIRCYVDGEDVDTGSLENIIGLQWSGLGMKTGGKEKSIIIKDYIDGMEKIMKKYAKPLKSIFTDYTKKRTLDPDEDTGDTALWDELVVNNFKIQKIHVAGGYLGPDYYDDEVRDRHSKILSKLGFPFELWEDVGDLVDYITRTVQKIKL